MRADVLLVQRGLAPSRALAQRLIEAGHVYARAGDSRVAILKPSANLNDDADLIVQQNKLDRFVSRGGLKLEGALERVGLDVAGFHCLDVGQSTGGFTDCLLQHGAAHVIGVDVGHAQLHSTLRSDPRVTCIEGLNARALSVETLATLERKAAVVDQPIRAQARSHNQFDLIVADVSFISLTKVIDAWSDLLASRGQVLTLVKPQFEVGADRLARGGIVRGEALFVEVEAKTRAAFVARGFKVLDYFASSIEGGDGNREFFLFGAKP